MVPIDAQDDEGAVVVRLFGAAAEFVGCRKDRGAHGLAGCAGRQRVQSLSKTLETEPLFVGVHGLENSIGAKARGEGLAEMDGENAFELGDFLVPEHHAEEMVVHDFF